MPRQARLDVPGLYHHVIARGIERRLLFRDDIDRLDFLQRFGKLLDETGSRCFAWALMPNHFHLLIQSGVRGISELMQRLLTGYVGTFNRRYKRVGHLFQNRFKSILCDQDSYFKELVRYIHLNPVRAGLLTFNELAHYLWTGHSVLLGNTLRSWQEIPEMLAWWGSTPSEAQSSYRRFITEGLLEEEPRHLEGGGLLKSLGAISAGQAAAIRQMDKQVFDFRILGDGHFVEQVLRQSDLIEQKQHRLKTEGWTLESMLRAITQATGVDRDAVKTGKRSSAACAARAMLAYAAKEWLGMTGTQVSQFCQVSQAAISKSWQRGKNFWESTQLPSELRKLRS
jgi:REP element-mobilizing transposase RayT